MKTTKILRHKILEPKLDGKPIEAPTTPMEAMSLQLAGQQGKIKQPDRTTIELPAGSSVLFAEISSGGGFNLWTIGGDPDTTEKRSFFACRTGVELPEAILDARHLGTYQGLHLFELQPHQVKAFQGAESGL